MTLINWTNDLSVHIQEIDEEHKMLVSMINKLHTALKTGQGKQVLAPILEEMTNYSVKHFHTEENYMRKFKYPQYEKHKKEHDNFIGKVMDFKKKFEKGELLLSIEVMRFLSTWLQSHIQGSDKAYSKFFNDNGLK